ncbi:CubicO group peptidase (beta-lactamase class C family) [Actinoalloteichus hoggarensis]|uniref:Esterase EstB n=1 Tax=Actinoalloteichus hoggarensis TaxID=1470176 RepID=A0A221W5F6_9PSEU|nr:serine hydrolase domain-containing protein [Actinoalloteichus hoggarensis]ASO20931.1 Esterase EstB [Actinoalloteichus hoggarensis]MBB5920861.1 CubicO group peptidase (beta-lactamase class C family) [Actinoalloteichus hoggarensis]
MNDVQKLVQEAIDRLVDSGTEIGVQVAAYRHGELIVDAVAGVSDPATGRPVLSSTPFNSFSTGKGVTSTVVHVLVDRGVLDYDEPIARLWPEFAAHGKERTTLRHVLTHSAGVPGLPQATTPEDLCDWDVTCARIADTEPWWEPGTRTGYHAQTYGYLVGEVVRRATGTPISTVLREEITVPLGIADELFFGVPESDLERLAVLTDAADSAAMFAAMPPDFPLFAAVPTAVMPTAAYGNRRDVLTADIPAGGTMTARAVARMYAALLGEVDGVRLVSPARLREISAVQTRDVDQVTGHAYPKALGYNVGRPGTTSEATPGVFGMVGMGGSAAYADSSTGVTVALTKNRFDPFAPSPVDGIGAIVAELTGGG